MSSTGVDASPGGGRLLVCLDARVSPGRMGGVEPYIAGLGRALLDHPASDQRYVFLVRSGGEGWLREAVGPDAQPMVEDPSRSRRSIAARVSREVARARSRAGRLAASVRGRGEGFGAIPRSSGAIEHAGVGVMHFTHQSWFTTGVPSVYQPHDLQHLHLPRCFEPSEVGRREWLYRGGCDAASAVVVSSSWTREDLVRRYWLDGGRVFAVSYPPPGGVASGGAVDPGAGSAVASRHGLEGPFLYYASSTWPHKNHLRLVEAVALLRDERGLDVRVACSGALTAHAEAIAGRIAALGLGGRVRLLGHLPRSEVDALYGACLGVVIPTLFESASYPLWEAMACGRAVACSRVTSLPAQSGGAALLFDAEDVRDMAGAMARLWEDGGLRASLAERGLARVSGLTPGLAARGFQAVYRRVAGVTAREGDAALLSGGGIA